METTEICHAEQKSQRGFKNGADASAWLKLVLTQSFSLSKAVHIFSTVASLGCPGEALPFPG